jgi:hypothetical protein
MKDETKHLIYKLCAVGLSYEQAVKAAIITAETVADSHKGLNGQWLFWVNVKNELKEL